SDVLEATLERVASGSPADAYFPLLALYHEDMHAEAFLMSLQTLGLPGPSTARNEALPAPKALATREVVFEGGTFELGSGARADFVFDNERCAHEVEVAPFALATGTVTQAQYRD